MPDLSRLVSLLESYSATLQGQRLRVGAAHRDVEDAYRRLDAVYGGVGATEFKEAWKQANVAFDVFDEGVPQLTSLLEEKIAQLRRVDQGPR